VQVACIKQRGLDESWMAVGKLTLWRV